MDLEVLKKKISTYRGEGGRVRITDDQLYMEILLSWEQWKGSSKEFYKAIGISQKGMSGVIGKAKRMRREGYFPAQDFKEIKMVDEDSEATNTCLSIEIIWGTGQVIRFKRVDDAVDFLKKAG